MSFGIRIEYRQQVYLEFTTNSQIINMTWTKGHNLCHILMHKNNYLSAQLYVDTSWWVQLTFGVGKPHFDGWKHLPKSHIL